MVNLQLIDCYVSDILRSSLKRGAMLKEFLNQYILVVVKETHATFYNVSRGNIDASLIVSLYDKKLDKLDEFVKISKSTPIKIFLDLSGESYRIVEIPDVASRNLKNAVQEIVNDELKKHKIVFPFLLSKPTSSNQSWKYIFFRFAMNKDIPNFIAYLMKSFNKVQGIYLSQVNNTEIAERLLGKKKDIAQKTSVFLMSPSDLTREFIYTNKHLQDIRKYSSNLSKLADVIFPKKAGGKNLLNQARKDCFAIIKKEDAAGATVQTVSYNEAVTKIGGRAHKDLHDLLPILFFIKNPCEAVNIPSLKKVNAISTLYRLMHLPIAVVMCFVLWVTLIEEKASVKGLSELNHLKNELQNSLAQHEREATIHEESIALFKQNSNLKRLHHIIRTSQYPIEILNKIKIAKTPHFMLDNFVYNKQDNIDGKSIITFDIDCGLNCSVDEGSYFMGINLFINNLKKQLPDKEISFYRLTKDLSNKTTFSNIPIGIRIIEPL